ncbi:MAG TPA: hypothetical protein VEY51_11135, partial [Chondromyces sp.]|nr:hypothetical protein [Chondromyces sp.]
CETFLNLRLESDKLILTLPPLKGQADLRNQWDSTVLFRSQSISVLNEPLVKAVPWGQESGSPRLFFGGAFPFGNPVRLQQDKWIIFWLSS